MVIKVEDKRSFTPEGELKERVKSEEKREKPKEEKKEVGFPPPPTFSEFLMSLYASCMLSMGAMEVEGAQKQEVDFIQAKQTIDVLEILYEKTKGNLSREEKSLYDNILSELKLTFVKLWDKK